MGPHTAALHAASTCNMTCVRCINEMLNRDVIWSAQVGGGESTQACLLCTQHLPVRQQFRQLRYMPQVVCVACVGLWSLTLPLGRMMQYAYAVKGRCPPDCVLQIHLLIFAPLPSTSEFHVLLQSRGAQPPKKKMGAVTERPTAACTWAYAYVH